MELIESPFTVKYEICKKYFQNLLLFYTVIII